MVANIPQSPLPPQKPEAKLSQEDIRALMDNPTAETKIALIEKLSGQYNTHKFTDVQLKLAEQIFRLLLKQAEIEVRKALSENLMTSKDVPKDVILTLARDVEEVSLPVLEFSEILGDEELLEIVSSSEKTSTLAAIANRQTVSEKVSGALVEKNNEEVVNHLLENQGAKISDASFEKVVTNFGQNEKIVDTMLQRGTLSNHIIQVMTTKVSKAIQSKLELKYKSSFTEINTFFQESGELAAVKFMGKQPIDKEMLELVDNLEKNNQLIQALHPSHGMLTQLLDGMEQLGRLTPLSALALGHLTLFQISVARLTGIPFVNVRKLVTDREGGLKALYERAQLPLHMFEAVQLVVYVVQEMEMKAKAKEGPRPSKDLHQMIKNIMIASKGQRVRNLAHFISLIRHHIELSQGEW